MIKKSSKFTIDGVEIKRGKRSRINIDMGSIYDFTDVKMRPVKGIVELNVKKGAAKQSFVNVIFNGEAKYSKEEELKLGLTPPTP